MADLTLAISQPAHGAAINGPVALKATASGATAGLFYRWYSSLYGGATQAQPEINASHAPAVLGGTVSALGEFGSHVLTLAANDQDGNTLAAIQAVKRSAMTGGAPPQAPSPCVVHQVAGAKIAAPGAGQTLSKAAATVKLLAPGAWIAPDPAHPGSWIANAAYQQINGIALALGLAPAVGATPANSASIALDLPALPWSQDSTGVWLTWSGALPAQLGSGNHLLTLTASAGAASASVSVPVVLAA